jgi:Mrp family chromosome partitioning ATPase
MSKNFELLMELEKVFGSARPEPLDGHERSAIPLPTLPARDLHDGDPEVVRLVQQVFTPDAGTARRHVVFCGIDAANPSSSVCARTARSLAARTHEKVCLVDANHSPAGLSGLFGILTDVVPGGVDSEHCLPIGSNLWLTGWSTRNGNGHRGSSELQAKLAELQRDFGYVLIDAPGCAVSDEAIVLGQLSDAVILVIEAESTRRISAAKAKHNLEAAGVCLAGTVLHNRSFPIPKALYQRL